MSRCITAGLLILIQASKQARRFSFLTGATKLVFVRIAVHSFTSLVAPLPLRQFRFLTGSNKLVFVCIEQKVLLLVKWDQHFYCRYFSIFFLGSTKTRIGDFFPAQMFFKRIFYFCSLICVFVLLLGCVFVLLVFFVLFVLFGAFCAIWCFVVRAKFFRKKRIKSLKLR